MRVGSADVERCLIYNLRAEKQWCSEENYKNIFKRMNTFKL